MPRTADRHPERPAKNVPSANKIRFRVTPRDVPPINAARRLHLTLEQFDLKKEELFARQFPRPDPTTGMFDLVAIDAWQDARNPQVFSGAGNGPVDARTVAEERLAQTLRGTWGRIASAICCSSAGVGDGVRPRPCGRSASCSSISARELTAADKARAIALNDEWDKSRRRREPAPEAGPTYPSGSGGRRLSARRNAAGLRARRQRASSGRRST